MAEFVDIMNIKRRMDNYYDDCSCGCPLYLSNFCSLSEESLTAEDFKEAERIMLEWSEEHPAPVYPTFREWLISIGVIDQMSTHSVIADILAMTPIPVDMAKKLGIKPKE